MKLVRQVYCKHCEHLKPHKHVFECMDCGTQTKDYALKKGGIIK